MILPKPLWCLLPLYAIRHNIMKIEDIFITKECLKDNIAIVAIVDRFEVIVLKLPLIATLSSAKLLNAIGVSMHSMLAVALHSPLKL